MISLSNYSFSCPSPNKTQLKSLISRISFLIISKTLKEPLLSSNFPAKIKSVFLGIVTLMNLPTSIPPLKTKIFFVSIPSFTRYYIYLLPLHVIAQLCFRINKFRAFQNIGTLISDYTSSFHPIIEIIHRLFNNLDIIKL